MQAPNNALPSRTSPTDPHTLHVIKRDGSRADFDPERIRTALAKAFLASEGEEVCRSQRVHDALARLTHEVIEALSRRPAGSGVHIEDIQDQVELALMRAGEHRVARAFVLYREERARARREATPEAETPEVTGIRVVRTDEVTHLLTVDSLDAVLDEACEGLAEADPALIREAAWPILYDGMGEAEVDQALIMATRPLVEHEPTYSQVAARLLLHGLCREALSFVYGARREAQVGAMAQVYPDYFPRYIRCGVELNLLDERLLAFDLERLAAALAPQRDRQFGYLGLQTLYDRYFQHWEGTRFELPQAFFMRVAMGLALNESEREEQAIRFYRLLASFDFMASTPTLFNAGTRHPQLSSCYLTTVPDDLDGIYSAIRDNALLSKFAGGLGNDWTRVRALGAPIRGTNGTSQGVVPFLKVANDTAVAVNQCFAPETHVLTAEGIRAIENIRIGDLVIGQGGQYREVLDHMTYEQTGPMVALCAKHAIRPLRVTAGHPFWAIKGVPTEQSGEHTSRWLEKGKITPDWIEAGELETGDYVAQVIPRETVPVHGLEQDDARLYGILLGDGHLSKDGRQWGISGNPRTDTHLPFVRAYLERRGIHYWESNRGETYLQIHWAAGHDAVRDATTGRIAGPGTPTLPFDFDDLYDASKTKRIARRFMHLPRSQTLQLVRGLLETKGGVSRGKAIYFTNTSMPLIEGLRYQLLRLGVPAAGQLRERAHSHEGRRGDGSVVSFAGSVAAADLRIPAVPEIAELVGCRPITKRNWIEHKGCLFTRLRSVDSIQPVPEVHDLKVEGDASYMTTAALAHNGGKRKGAVCAYLEVWHLDIADFLELRKNTGDERRRTHDMNTACWIPDLFMQRVEAEGEWTLFSPDEVGDLHEVYGTEFAERYAAYEAAAERGEIRNWRRVSAVQLWRQLLTMLFETGHPWLTFKDPSNLRSPQQHAGVVHSSNLCTEVILNTSDDEVAVCNLGSVNLAAHVDPESGLDNERLERTVGTAMRLLDNVIDLNYYAVPAARRANLRHRPVGLGLMGFQDALYRLGLPYASEEAVAFADRSTEALSYYAIRASTELAEERGRYASFDGSLWSQGVLPIDSIARVREARGGDCTMDESTTREWDDLRERVQRLGMRNANCLAIAPTATIANITGVSPSIEPTYQNLFVKSNLSGEFTVVNPYLVADLKARGLWDEVMVSDLKYHEGSVQAIQRVPDDLKRLYATAFEIDPQWLVDAGSRRQKWLDQSQSLNLYLAEPSGPKLDALYRHAWRLGLKTTYYLRSKAATGVATEPADPEPATDAMDDPGCEVCQ